MCAPHLIVQWLCVSVCVWQVIGFQWNEQCRREEKLAHFECVHDVPILVYITLKLGASAWQSFPSSLVLSILWLSCQHFGKCFHPHPTLSLTHLHTYTLSRSFDLAHPNSEIELIVFLLSILPFWFHCGVCALDWYTYAFASNFLLLLSHPTPLYLLFLSHCIETKIPLRFHTCAVYHRFFRPRGFPRWKKYVRIRTELISFANRANIFDVNEFYQVN